MTAADWFLTAEERGNAFTALDRRHRFGQAWTAGNTVRPLVHGASYFAELVDSVRAMQAGDLLLFADWRGDPDERLDGLGTEVSGCWPRRLRAVWPCGAWYGARIWTGCSSPERENRHLGEDIDAAGGLCLLDMRVRPGGSHHQKFVVLRHPGRPERDVAFVGGIDLCHGRRDDARHLGDPQRQPMSEVYGPRPPWHDVQVAIHGPAVGDVETVFRERWDDPAPLTRDPLRRLATGSNGSTRAGAPSPNSYTGPTTRGRHGVQLLRTYPARRHGYPFAPTGERSVARAMAKVLARARRLIYVEDQYLWSRRWRPRSVRPSEVTRVGADRGAATAPRPGRPVLEGADLLGRYQSLRMLHEAAGDRVAVYGLENHEGTPVYVHAEVCIIDDTWASVGSDNFNRRSWSHDSELSCAVIDEDADDGGADDRGRGNLPFVRVQTATDPRPRTPRPSRWRRRRPVRSPGAFDRSPPPWPVSTTGTPTGDQGPRPPGRLRRYERPELDVRQEPATPCTGSSSTPTAGRAP